MNAVGKHGSGQIMLWAICQVINDTRNKDASALKALQNHLTVHE